MGTIFACERSSQVRKLVLLAPALLQDSKGIFIDPVAGKPLKLSAKLKRGLGPISAPTLVIHGTTDDVVPLEPVRRIVEKLFTNYEYIVVDDGHRLQEAFKGLNWEEILGADDLESKVS